jgi:hypothetical protein
MCEQGKKILVKVASFMDARRLAKVCPSQTLLVFQVPEAFAADSYTDTLIGFAIYPSVPPSTSIIIIIIIIIIITNCN